MVPLSIPEDTGYDSCNSGDQNIGFRHRESNLANCLGMRLPWAGWKLETMRISMIDLFAWLPERHKWGERRVSKVSWQDKEEQLKHEAQDQFVLPVVPAAEIVEHRYRQRELSLKGKPSRIHLYECACEIDSNLQYTSLLRICIFIAIELRHEGNHN